MLGWVLFRADTLGHALAFFRRIIADPTAPAIPGQSVWLHLDNGVALALVLGCVGATPLVPRLWAWRASLVAPSARGLAPSARELAPSARRLDDALAVAQLVALVVIFVLSAAALAASTYNPFIYYRF